MTFVAIAPTSRIATAVVITPRPGTRRPSHRSYSGDVTPSTMPKIQMKAATVMNSGTVTKKPAMKLRRSHCIKPDHHAGREHQPVAREDIKRVAREKPDEVL